MKIKGSAAWIGSLMKGKFTGQDFSKASRDLAANFGIRIVEEFENVSFGGFCDAIVLTESPDGVNAEEFWSAPCSCPKFFSCSSIDQLELSFEPDSLIGVIQGSDEFGGCCF
jgi:hypothetical protein